MQKKTFLTALITAIVCICIGIVIIFNGIMGQIQTEGTMQNTVSLYDGWKIGNYKGYVALFKGSGEVPVKVYETPVSSLREYDRRLITDGFYTYDIEVAQRYIEELTS